MTPNQLQELLSKQFNLIAFVDLADLSDNPSAVFNFFKSKYQEEFQNNDRIVIYTSRSISDQLIAHLYHTANFIDISNWFILLCTTTDISQQLSEVCCKESTDSISFQNFVIDLDHTKNLSESYILPETMCAIPWMNLEITSPGDIKPCCVSKDPIGNIQKNSLNDVFYSDYMQQLRQDFLNGKKNPNCNTCWHHESKGLTSIRQINIKRLKEPFLTKFLHKPEITQLDIKFQNTCNFKCRICNRESSSLYAAEESKFRGIPLVTQSNWSEGDNFINQINNLLPSITNIDMYGGEPFLIKRFAETLRLAVNQDLAKNIRLHYNSNGSVWPTELIKYWPNFKLVDINFSIDAIGNQFNLQRGGSWNDVESNILKIKNLGFSNISISIMPTISIMNILYIDQVIGWATRHNFQVFVNYLSGPPEFALSGLTKEAKDMILKKHQNSSWPEMKNILNYIQSLPDSNGTMFCKKTQWFDSIRQENFSDSHFDIANAMGYVYNKQV